MVALAEGTCLALVAALSHPPLTSSGQPVMLYLSHYCPKCVRHTSSIGPGMGLGGDIPDVSDCPGGHVMVKFPLSGEHCSGVTLNEALSSKRLSNSCAYILCDITLDMYREIKIKVGVCCMLPVVLLVVVCT
jgi:hypothetical protein